MKLKFQAELLLVEILAELLAEILEVLLVEILAALLVEILLVEADFLLV
ncbi:hypothetical protein [Brachyspira aalborgi]|jgi:predicted amidophosphoribosyltransferase|nr:hypothetical protein [Brachyspira aalborgi]